MAASLLSPGRIKHVVPWKTREEFLSVYRGLYNEDESQQELAIRRIAVWKSRAGSKLSVAIESSGMLTQACLDHARTKREGSLLSREAVLRSCYSLALIRFVNHVTEKGQTKAIAQPVHLVAREFGIPEWIVRLRHDATHSSLPSLGALVTGSRWALHYLKEHFWKHQTLENVADDKDGEVSPRGAKMSVIRRTFYDFQKVRYQELNAEGEEKEECSVKISDTMKILQKYLTQNRLRFIKCFLEDGILISTEEQLVAFGVSADDLMSQLPPTIPLEITEFWRPLLKKVNSSGAIPLVAQTAVFSVSSGEGIRNYQLIAWVAYLLSLQLDPNDKSKRKKRKRKQEAMFKITTPLPLKTMLSTCLQNVNLLTAYLLKYLADEESLGAENYNKLMKLLDVHSQAAGKQASSDESDSDTVYTVEDIKRASEKQSSSQEITSSTVHNIQNNICGNNVCWRICTDIVDWASVPLGTLPHLSDEDDSGDDEDDDQDISVDTATSKGRDPLHNSDDNDDDYMASRRKTSRKRRTIDDDDEDSDDSGSGTSPKRSQLTVTDSRLL